MPAPRRDPAAATYGWKLPITGDRAKKAHRGQEADYECDEDTAETAAEQTTAGQLRGAHDGV